MKVRKKLLSAVLLLAMLLSQFGVMAPSAAAAEGVTTVKTDSELAYAPLAESSSIAYEQHGEGYTVSLDRAADSVSMNISAVPKNGRDAEKAQLFIRTGVELKAGTAYRVSFALSAEKPQPEYAVSFDGGSVKGAYGRLDGRSIQAGGTDRVSCKITGSGKGELVLRLLLGKTEAEGNLLHFSDLAVEETPENAVGEDVVLVDRLDYSAPGAIRSWTNSDSGAVMTSDEKSATLTVTKVPAKGAEVWKIKLMVYTGLIPEAGKTYRIRADLQSTRGGSYEVCFNEGETEKGYDVLYNQQLSNQKQTLDRRIYVTSDKENPGELILQFSLGKLSVGSKVTISNVRIEEAIPKYTNALPKDFAYDKTWIVEEYDPNNQIVVGASEIPAAISWNGQMTASKAGNFAGDITSSGGSATLQVKGGQDVWDAMLHVYTGVNLVKGATYRASFKVRAERDYSNYEVLYGQGLADGTWDNDNHYGSIKKTGLQLAANTTEEVSAQFVSDGGELLITLQVGATGGRENAVTVSDVKIESVDMDSGTPIGSDIASVTYPSGGGSTPNPGSFSAREDGDYKGTITGDGSSATMTCTGGDAGEGGAWKRGLFTGEIASLSAGTRYQVSFDITADHDTPFEVCYNKDSDWDTGEKGFGWKGGLTATSTTQTVTYLTSADGGKLRLRIDLGRAAEDTKVTVSNIQVRKLEGTPTGDNLATSVNYSGFTARDNKGTISNGGNSAIMTCPTQDGSPAAWQRGMFTGEICQLSAGNSYQVRFDLQTNGNTFNYEVCYNKDEDWGDGKEGAFGHEYNLTASSTSSAVTHTVAPEEDGKLRIRIDLGLAPENTQVTVSNIRVQKLEEQPTGDNLATMTYPSGSRSRSGSDAFTVRQVDTFGGTITGDGASAIMTCTGGDAGEAWKRGMFTGSIASLSAGKSYQVSFSIEAGKNTPFEVCYNKDDDWTGEKAYGGEYGLTAGTTPVTVTHTVNADANSTLRLRIDLGRAEDNTKVTVSNIKVQEIQYPTTPVDFNSEFCSVWEDIPNDAYGYSGTLTKNEDNAVLRVTKSSGQESANWKAKLCIRTGVLYEEDKNYRVLFDIQAAQAQKEFVVVTKGVPDSEDIRGTWGLSLKAGETKTIATRAIPAGRGSGALDINIELGNLDGTSNTFTVSNVRVEEVSLKSAFVGMAVSGTFTADAQPGYRIPLTREKNSATLEILETPDTGMEFWKSKLFVDTGVTAHANESFRVSFDVRMENDADYEVCYNRSNKEKGFDAIYGLQAKGGTVKTVEKVFTAEEPGRLKVQLSLGMVEAPNAVTISNVRVERIAYSYSGKSALPTEITYRAPGAVSYWAHEDYTTTFTGSADAITTNITRTPARGAEPWKIKLFLDTGAVLKPGKYYKVTANLSAKAGQDYEICYNNGSVEMGYDSLGGLRLEAGKQQTVERILSVPANKTDASNLMLQINLGKTTRANAVTVGGVRVEEVSLSYAEMMSGAFTYKTGSEVSLCKNTDYDAALEGSGDGATLHITSVPATGAEVWKVKLFVNTGAILSAGRTYLVRADLLADKAQDYEVCFNNEETEKGFDVLYGQAITAGTKTTVEKKISVPASMTDAGELILQFSVGGAVANNITVSNVSVQELRFGGSGGGSPAPETAVSLYNGSGTLEVSREKLSYKLSESAGQGMTIAGAGLRAGDRYTVAFTARADRDLTGSFVCTPAGGTAAVITEPFQVTSAETSYSFTTKEPLTTGGLYDLRWQFAAGQAGTDVEISNITVTAPAEELKITRDTRKMTVNGKAAAPDAYSINGVSYIKLRDLAKLLNDTDAQFVIRYHKDENLISMTTGKPYPPLGNELTVGKNSPATCARNPMDVTVNGTPVKLKSYHIGQDDYFRLVDLNRVLGFQMATGTDTVVITSPPTPEAQEKAHGYNLYFLPEIDGESQGYVGDTMPFYDNGTYYIYYLKEGGDSYNHSVYVTTTKDFVHYTERQDPVLSASREDVQDSWIGTGSVVKVEGTYYFFYTGYNSSGSQEYHEKIMVAKGSSPTSFQKVTGWAITPPAELGQKNDFRDPQAYYDPATKTISLTVTASQDGKARILKYTLGKELQNPTYDGIIFTDPTGAFWNMECSDTFRMGNKWYLTYSGQEDTLWYAMADSRFGPYTEPMRLEGTLFYAAKHVENGKNTYMVGWARRSNSASSTQEVSGWAGNLVVQKLLQLEDGSLALVPVDSVVSAFKTPRASTLGASGTVLSADTGYSFRQAFTSCESFMLSGEFTCTGTGTFGLAFDFNGQEDRYKLISLDPEANKVKLSFEQGTVPITETQAAVTPNQKHTFTYVQDGSVGIFYLDHQAALTVRMYGVTDKPIYLFAQNNSVTFTSLRQYMR